MLEAAVVIIEPKEDQLEKLCSWKRQQKQEEQTQKKCSFLRNTFGFPSMSLMRREHVTIPLLLTYVKDEIVSAARHSGPESRGDASNSL